MGFFVPGLSIFALVVGVGLAMPEEAMAQDAGTLDHDVGNSASSAPVATVAPGKTAASRCKDYDPLNSRAQMVLLFTPTCETVAPELGGLRSTLAQAGIGVSLTVSPSFTYDVLGHDERLQLYGGQRPTLDRSVVATVTGDLGRLGVPGDAQLIVQGTYSGTNYPNGTPRYLAVSTLAIDQRFAGGNIELLYGFYPLIRQFYGVVLGGNASAAALGPTSVIPYQVGVSAFTPTPAITLHVQDPKTHLYDTLAVSRSTSPAGIRDEAERNPSGLAISLRGSRPLIMEEFGYKIDSGNGQHGLWLRAGGIYNLSRYGLWHGGLSRDNYGLYLAGTYQLTQPHGDARGLNIDVKFDYAPPDRNLYKSDVQGTVFYIGPFARRAEDMVSLGLTRNFFSHDAVRTTEMSGEEVSSGSLALSGSYAFRVVHGIYWVSGLTYTRHPTFAPARPDAVLLQQSLNIAFCPTARGGQGISGLPGCRSACAFPMSPAPLISGQIGSSSAAPRRGRMIEATVGIDVDDEQGRATNQLPAGRPRSGLQGGSSFPTAVV